MATITTEMTETYFSEQPKRPLIYYIDEICFGKYVGKKVAHDFKELIKENTKLNIDWSLVR